MNKNLTSFRNQTAGAMTVFVTLALNLAGVYSIRAADVTWTGGGVTTDNWSDSGNWGGVVPAANDALFFDGGVRLTPNNDLTAGTAFNGIVFNSGASAFTLGGNSVAGFSTPLATLHAFQGDADVFLTTPAQGVTDRYAKLGYRTGVEILGTVRKVAFVGWYHAYKAAQGSSDLGHELDFDAVANINEHWRIDGAYAAYAGTLAFASRNKTWLSLTFS